jgi:hypothetical protein
MGRGRARTVSQMVRSLAQEQDAVEDDLQLGPIISVGRGMYYKSYYDTVPKKIEQGTKLYN